MHGALNSSPRLILFSLFLFLSFSRSFHSTRCLITRLISRVFFFLGSPRDVAATAAMNYFEFQLRRFTRSRARLEIN